MTDEELRAKGLVRVRTGLFSYKVMPLKKFAQQEKARVRREAREKRQRRAALQRKAKKAARRAVTGKKGKRKGRKKKWIIPGILYWQLASRIHQTQTELPGLRLARAQPSLDVPRASPRSAPQRAALLAVPASTAGRAGSPAPVPRGSRTGPAHAHEAEWASVRYPAGECYREPRCRCRSLRTGTSSSQRHRFAHSRAARNGP